MLLLQRSMVEPKRLTYADLPQLAITALLNLVRDVFENLSRNDDILILCFPLWYLELDPSITSRPPLSNGDPGLLENHDETSSQAISLTS